MEIRYFTILLILKRMIITFANDFESNFNLLFFKFYFIQIDFKFFSIIK